MNEGRFPEIKYSFATNVKGEAVSIDQIDESNRRTNAPFLCLGCGEELIAHLGNKRRHHFKHKQVTSSCATETYLHNLAKQTFFDAYKDALRCGRAFILWRAQRAICKNWKEKFGLVCERDRARKAIDLTRWFDQVALEAAVGNFRADVLLSSTRGPAQLLIEIAVTHPCAEEKLNSGLRIVEIKVDEERDIAALRHSIDENHSGTKLINFREQPPLELPCNWRCESRVTALVKYQNGLVKLVRDHPLFLADELSKPTVTSYEITQRE